jgi:hypothetical protein
MPVYAGYTRDMRMAMIARTTINSIRVKAREKKEFLAMDIGPHAIGPRREVKAKKTCYKEVA